MADNLSDRIDFLKEFLDRYEVDYIIFENGEVPLKVFEDSLGLEIEFESETVRIYSL